MKFKFRNGSELKTIYTPNELQEIVGTSASYYANKAEKLQVELNKTREEIRQEIKNEFKKKIEHLEFQLRSSIATLSSEKELKDYNEFVEKHIKCKDKSRLAGVQMPIIRQVGTGLGVCTEIQCPICKEKKDITDISIW